MLLLVLMIRPVYGSISNSYGMYMSWCMHLKLFRILSLDINDSLLFVAKFCFQLHQARELGGMLENGKMLRIAEGFISISDKWIGTSLLVGKCNYHSPAPLANNCVGSLYPKAHQHCSNTSN